MFTNKNTSVVYFEEYSSKETKKIEKKLVVRYCTPNDTVCLEFKNNTLEALNLACSLLSMEKIENDDIHKVGEFLKTNQGSGIEIYRGENITRYRIVEIDMDHPHFNPTLKSTKFNETFLNRGCYAFPDLATICNVLNQDAKKSMKVETSLFELFKNDAEDEFEPFRNDAKKFMSEVAYNFKDSSYGRKFTI